MYRFGLFWKMLLQGVGVILATTLVMTAGSHSWQVRGALLLLVLIAVVVHAVWITRREQVGAALLADAIHKMGTERTDGFGIDALPVEVTSLAAAAADLHRRMLNRIDELQQGNADFGNAMSLLEAVLSTMVEGVVVLDREQRILFSNPASRPLLDIQSESIIGRPLWEVARLSEVRNAVEQVLAFGNRQVAEFRVPRTKLIVAATIAPLPREPVPGIMLVLHDVTELRRLEGMRRDFVSNVSHELKTPLTSIQAYADTLLEDDERDPQQLRTFLEKIVEQAERLGALIVDVIRLGQIESQHDTFDARPVAVRSVMDACLGAHLAIAAAKGIDLQSEAGRDGVFVLAEADELRTILDNLVDNALHYTPAGGSVRLRVIDDATQQDFVGIEVADTGIGLAKDQRARIFERFFRVDRARDRQKGGTGLGLAIVKHLCQMFGGRVEVASELGVGSRFTVWLPVAQTGNDSATTEAGTVAVIETSADA